MLQPLFRKVKPYLPHFLSGILTLLFGTLWIFFTVSYIQQQSREDSQLGGECFVFSAQAIWNTTCPSGLRCLLYNLTYYLDIGNIKYYGFFYKAFQSDHLHLPFIQYCYYWNMAPYDVQFTKLTNSPTLVILFTIFFFSSLFWNILIFCFCKREGYTELNS